MLELLPKEILKEITLYILRLEGIYHKYFKDRWSYNSLVRTSRYINKCCSFESIYPPFTRNIPIWIIRTNVIIAKAFQHSLQRDTRIVYVESGFRNGGHIGSTKNYTTMTFTWWMAFINKENGLIFEDDTQKEPRCSIFLSTKEIQDSFEVKKRHIVGRSELSLKPKTRLFKKAYQKKRYAEWLKQIQ